MQIKNLLRKKSFTANSLKNDKWNMKVAYFPNAVFQKCFDYFLSTQVINFIFIHFSLSKSKRTCELSARFQDNWKKKYKSKKQTKLFDFKWFYKFALDLGMVDADEYESLPESTPFRIVAAAGAAAGVAEHCAMYPVDSVKVSFIGAV